MFPILLANLVTQVMTARTPPRRERRPGRVRKGRRKPINLGLQGGGAHGAFTWGVLDQLLDDGRLEIEGISGASAGAVNAIMLADGLARGGPDEARQRLADFWRAVSVDGHLPDLQRGVVERLFPFVPREGLWFGAMSRMLSPYDLNPLNINPLKDVIERFVDFEAVRAHHGLDLFISATNVHTGELRVFERAEISPEVVMASASMRCAARFAPRRSRAAFASIRAAMTAGMLGQGRDRRPTERNAAFSVGRGTGQRELTAPSVRR